MLYLSQLYLPMDVCGKLQLTSSFLGRKDSERHERYTRSVNLFIGVTTYFTIVKLRTYANICTHISIYTNLAELSFAVVAY